MIQYFKFLLIAIIVINTNRIVAQSLHLEYSTFLGGSSDDRAHGMAIDKQGNIYLTAPILSADFPITADALNSIPSGIYLAKINAGGEIFFTADTPGDGLNVIKKVNGQWSEPQTANLRGNNSWEFEAFYSVDGQKLFFTSITDNGSKFWIANKTGSNWSRPEYQNSPVNNTPVMWCTFTSDGTMYYGNNDNWVIEDIKNEVETPGRASLTYNQQ